MASFWDLEAEFQLGLRFSAHAKQLWEALGVRNSKLPRKQWQRNWGSSGEFSKRVPTFKTSIGALPNPLLSNPISPCPPNSVSRSSWCIASYEHKQMLQRNLFLLLNCSKHVSVFLALGMFWVRTPNSIGMIWGWGASGAWTSAPTSLNQTNWAPRGAAGGPEH